MSFVVHTEVTVELKPMECSCGAVYGISKEKYQYCLDTGAHWFCPNGCQRVFTKPRNSELKEQIEKLERRINLKDEIINNKANQIQQLNYSVRSQKAAKTKIINRVKNGVCPCCNRTFTNLQGHFKSKHPELLELKS